MCKSWMPSSMRTTRADGRFSMKNNAFHSDISRYFDAPPYTYSTGIFILSTSSVISIVPLIVRSMPDHEAWEAVAMLEESMSWISLRSVAASSSHAFPITDFATVSGNRLVFIRPQSRSPKRGHLGNPSGTSSEHRLAELAVVHGRDQGRNASESRPGVRGRQQVVRDGEV